MILNDGTRRPGIWKYTSGNLYEKGDLLILSIDQDNDLELQEGVYIASVNPDKVSTGYFRADNWKSDIESEYIIPYRDSDLITKTDALGIVLSNISKFKLDTTSIIDYQSVSSITVPGLYKIDKWVEGLPEVYDTKLIYNIYLYGFINEGDNPTDLESGLISNFGLSEEHSSAIVSFLIDNPSSEILFKQYSDQTTFEETDKDNLDRLSTLISYRESQESAKLIKNFTGYLRVSIEGSIRMYEFLDFTNGRYFVSNSNGATSILPWKELTCVETSDPEELGSKDLWSSKLAQYISSARTLSTNWTEMTSNYKDRLKYELAVSGSSDNLFPDESGVCYLYGLKVLVTIGENSFYRKYTIKIDKTDAPDVGSEFVYDEYGSKLSHLSNGEYRFNAGTGVEITSIYKGYVGDDVN